MKKLMIAAAIVCAAAFANAATVNWTGMAVAQDPDKNPVNSYGVYLIDANKVALSAMTAALAGGDFSKLSGDAIVRSTTSLAAGTTARWQDNNWGSYATDTKLSWYTIILNDDIGDATYFMATSQLELTAPSAGNVPANFGAQTANSWNKIESIPEPTSGLLLLLGVAGLALRRRRA